MVPLAFVAPSLSLRGQAIAWLGGVGILFSFANWAILVATALGKSSASMVPPVGAALLALAIAAVPAPFTRWWAAIGLIADPWILAMLAAWLRSHVSGK
jgi:hypothetical protein